jgi:hypothetical protein
MKYAILIFILAAMALSSFAQIQKGAGYFGGVLSGYYNNAENPESAYSNSNRSNSWNFNISYGHYLTDRFAIGLGAGFTASDYKYEGVGINYSTSNKQTSKLYYIAPFIRTSKKIADNFYCFANLTLQAGTGPVKETFSSSNSETELTNSTQVSLGAGLAGGLNYFLNRHFALYLSYGNITYNNTTIENDDDSDGSQKATSDAINVNLGLSSITIGLQYFINNSAVKK